MKNIILAVMILLSTITYSMDDAATTEATSLQAVPYLAQVPREIKECIIDFIISPGFLSTNLKEIKVLALTNTGFAQILQNSAFRKYLARRLIKHAGTLDEKQLVASRLGVVNEQFFISYITSSKKLLDLIETIIEKIEERNQHYYDYYDDVAYQDELSQLTKLLSLGADVNNCIDQSHYPVTTCLLHAAVRIRRTHFEQIAALLLNHSKTLHLYIDNTLLCAIQPVIANTEILRCLLNSPSSAYLSSNIKTTALFTLCANYIFIENGVLNALLDAGADITARCNGRTALMLYCACPALLNQGNNTVIELRKMFTDCAELAVKSQEDITDVVHVLLAAGVDVYGQDAEGKTALDLAQENGYSRIVEVIKEYMLTQ